MIISKRAVDDYLNRDFNNYLWMKRLTRESILAELKQLRVPPVFKTEPWLHQLVSFYIGLCEPRLLYLLDMGLGKSKIIQDLITQALREKKLKHALITVPRLINIESWGDDMPPILTWSRHCAESRMHRRSGSALLIPKGKSRLLTIRVSIGLYARKRRSEEARGTF